MNALIQVFDSSSGFSFEPLRSLTPEDLAELDSDW